MKTIVQSGNHPLGSKRLGLWAAMVALIGWSSAVVLAGETVPLTARLTGVLTPPTATAVGVGTQMGKFIQAMTFIELDLTTGAGYGTYVQKGANGDTISGGFTVQFISASDFLGTFTVTSGTGRFEGATGSGTSGGKLNPDMTFEYAYDGTITTVGSNAQ